MKLGQLLTGLLGLAFLGYGACVDGIAPTAQRGGSCSFAALPSVLACTANYCLLCTEDHLCRWIHPTECR